jgi:glycosyltransferase involved in cell wall biosynthesis
MAERLAIITHEYYPVLSGGTIFTEQLAKELAKLGWDIDLLTTYVGRGHPKVERQSGFEVHRFHTGRTSISDSTLLEHLSYFALGLPQMLELARRRRYTLLFPVFAIPSGLLALVISKALGIPSIVFVDAADTPGVESAMKTYVRYLGKIFDLVTNQSAAVTICEGLEDLALPRIHHSRAVAMPNGTVLPETTARPNTNGEALELLSIGRLVLRKGFQEIIQALGIVRRQRSDFHLRIVGYGRAEDEIRRVLDEQGITSNVSFLGRVEYQDLGKYYLSSDAYLFYGDREGSSLAMIEAASYGLPLIASDHPGNRSYVENGKSGFLVEHKNPEALARAVLELLAHRDALAAMGRRSREIAEMYSWAKVAARYDAYFRGVLRGSIA